MNLFEMASLPPTRMTAPIAAPARSQERGKDEVLLKLLQLEPDTMDHLFRVTGWDREITRRTLLQLVADGKVKCTNRDSFRWYSVRDEWRAGEMCGAVGSGRAPTATRETRETRD